MISINFVAFSLKTLAKCITDVLDPSPISLFFTTANDCHGHHVATTVATSIFFGCCFKESSSNMFVVVQ